MDGLFGLGPAVGPLSHKIPLLFAQQLPDDLLETGMTWVWESVGQGPSWAAYDPGLPDRETLTQLTRENAAIFTREFVQSDETIQTLVRGLWRKRPIAGQLRPTVGRSEGPGGLLRGTREPHWCSSAPGWGLTLRGVRRESGGATGAAATSPSVVRAHGHYSGPARPMVRQDAAAPDIAEVT